MKDLAPDIIRQRLLIEGLFEQKIDEQAVKRYLIEIAARLDLRTYGEPIVHAPGGARIKRTTKASMPSYR